MARSVAAQKGVAHRFTFDSAGTDDWHDGDPPDARAIAAAARRGIDLSKLRARPFTSKDFDAFSLIVAMDLSNQRNIERLRHGRATPVRLMMSFVDGCDAQQVADPYYGDKQSFETMLDDIKKATQSLIDQALRGSIEHS